MNVVWYSGPFTTGGVPNTRARGVLFSVGCSMSTIGFPLSFFLRAVTVTGPVKGCMQQFYRGELVFLERDELSQV